MQAPKASVGEGSCNTSNILEDWHHWCRLCAKVDTPCKNMFFEHQPLATSIGKTDDDNEYTMAKAIGKYFCVQIKNDDDLPKLLCTECISLLSTLLDFNERVAKVQEMYAALQSADYSQDVDFYSIRMKYGILKEDPLLLHQYEEKCFTDKVDHGSIADMQNFEIKLKEENPSDCSRTDKVAYAFESDGDVAEDPFASDIDVEPAEDKTSKSVENKGKRSGKSRFNDKSENFLRDSPRESTDSKYFCSNCSLHFQRLGNYRIHMKKRHGMALEPLTCPQCPKCFKNRYDLNRHIKKHRPRSETRIFPCPQCDRKFQTKDYVAKHIKFVHEDIRPFICEECGEGTRTEATLREHMLTHTDLAPFVCEICKKGFKNQPRLKNHMEIHSSNKHICSECGLQLNSRVTLNQHMLVHSDTMRHKCDYCGRAFKRAKTLKNHLILHSGLKPYSCEFCEKTFTNGSNCRTHMKRAHPSELAELEASGKRIFTKNIPKLAVLKSVMRVSDNLIPVVSKQSGNFASGKEFKAQSDSSVFTKHSEL